MSQRNGDAPGSAGHVLIVVENVSLGVDQRVRKQVPTLLAAGHRVSVITRRDPANASFRGVPGLTVLEHPAPAEPRRAVGYLGEYAAAVFWAVLLAMVAHARRRVDVVQLCQPPDLYFPLAWMMRGLGASVVLDQRDLMPELFAARYGHRRAAAAVLHWLERRTQRAVGSVLVVNEYLRRRLIGAGAAPERVTVVRNGPLLDRVLATAPLPALRGDAGHLCCWAGKMGRQDRLDLLVDAIDELVHARGRRDCRFAVLGDGEWLDELRAQVTDRGLDPWVTVPGWLTEAELYDHLATADVGLDTSLQPEVSPVKAMEYMAFGLPVLAFDLPETVALVGEAGVAVPAGDVQKFAAELSALLDDRPRRTRLGEHGRRRITDELCWERQAEHYVSVVDRAVHARRGARRARLFGPRTVRTSSKMR